uniref:Variant surface glycoprotein n=1 Tax=Trypanosoma brucei TaxID=5691 RepID=A0A1V0FZP6_9TRYP|nr:variant surface glycoprotein [Trypanosoma brucei]
MLIFLQQLAAATMPIGAQLNPLTASATTIGGDIQHWCHELSYLKEIKKQVEGNMQRRVEVSEKNTEVAAMWQLASWASSDQTTRTGAAVLAAYATKVLKQAAKAAAAKDERATKLLLLLDKRIATIQAREFARTALAYSKGTTNTAIRNTEPCVLAPTKAVDTEYSFPNPAGGGKLKTDEVAAKLHKATEIHLIELTDISSLIAKQTVQIQAKTTRKTLFSVGAGSLPNECKVDTGGDYAASTGGDITIKFSNAAHPTTTTAKKTIAKHSDQLPTGKEEKKLCRGLKAICF